MSGLLRHLPNLLTALRLAAAPALAVLLVRGADSAALGVFAFAGLSDVADGFLAKRFGLATRFGRLLDPAADKLLMLASFLALSLLKAAPFWLTLLVIARDIGIVGGVLLARILALPIRVTPLLIGKATTAMQIAYIALILLLLTFGLHWPQIENFAADATALLTIASWIAYAGVGLGALARPRTAA
jgi:cardiolipin synthase